MSNDPVDFGTSTGTSSPWKERDLPDTEQDWEDSQGTVPPTREPERSVIVDWSVD